MRRFALPCLLSVLLLCSCINNNYDLSDIDTTMRLRVNDFTVPLRLNTITLDKLLDLGDDSQIKKVIDPVTGEEVYAISQSGSYHSEPMTIEKFVREKPAIEPIRSNLDLVKINQELDRLLQTLMDQYVELQMKQYENIKGTPEYEKLYAEMKDEVKNHRQEFIDTIWSAFASNDILAEYDITEDISYYSTSSVVNKAVRSVKYLGASATCSVEVRFDQFKNLIDGVECYEMQLQLPKGLDIVTSVGKYDKTTGVLDLSDNVPVLKNGRYKLTVEITGIDAETAGLVLTTRRNEDGLIFFSDNLGVLRGRIVVRRSNFINGHTFFDLPDVATYVCVPDISEILVDKFSGKIRYEVDGMDVDPIRLDDLPDFMLGDETNIILGSPQIYLKLENPLYKDYKLTAETGLSIYGTKNGVDREKYSLDNGVIRADKAENVWCIAPEQPKKYCEGYEKAQFEPFSNLRKIVSGDGLPDQLNIVVENPCVPAQDVENFELGKPMGDVAVDYMFYAPLALDEGSVIVYEKKWDGWLEEEEMFKTLVIEKLAVSASITSTLPVGAMVSIYPIGKDGQRINDVEFTNVRIEANQAGQPLMFEQTGGVISEMDGIVIRAVVNSVGADKVMGPVQSIDVKDLKVKVTGYYDEIDED